MALRWQSPVYLERERLLSLLPEEPGFVVLLEAPAGFGKSVLAGQLSARLGLRTLWASARLGEPRALLARALDLPEEAPWGAVVAALRAFLVSLLHRQGVKEKKAALEAFSFNPLAALCFLGLYAV